MVWRQCSFGALRWFRPVGSVPGGFLVPDRPARPRPLRRPGEPFSPKEQNALAPFRANSSSAPTCRITTSASLGKSFAYTSFAIVQRATPQTGKTLYLPDVKSEQTPSTGRAEASLCCPFIDRS